MISVGDDHREVVGRQDAVREAKQHSSRTGRVIHVERRDGCVHMEFQRGRLQAYRFETRGPGSRS
ncbi:MAG: hypothetical protein H6732_10720 [Alphaproteobacteria bacterium]|nr:hypothetical protein [Alphaproteobacteria bacterium]